MMPGLDGSGCGVALVLLLMAIAAVVLNLAVLAALALRRSGRTAPAAEQAAGLENRARHRRAVEPVLRLVPGRASRDA